MLIFLLSLSASVFADKDRHGQMLHSLRTVLPDLDVTEVRQSRIAGLYEIMLGADVIYASADGRYILQGDLIDLKRKKNLSEEQRTQARAQILRDIPNNEMITFSPANPRHSIYVFTDISCGYCRKLHQDMLELNAHGIAVHYLAFPRQGPDSANARNMSSIWCANDRHRAMTDAKLGRGVKDKTCINPVIRQFELGRTMGVGGTPAVYLQDGRQIGGYLPAAELIRAVTQNQSLP